MCKKFFCLIIVVTIISSIFSVPVFASSNDIYYDHTSVSDDLESIYGANLYVKFPLNKSDKEIYLIDLFEYGFSEKLLDKSGDYGLYFYLYNPSGQDILGALGKIQFATEWKYDHGTNKYVATSYEKFSVYQLDTDDSNVLLKFKVVTNGKQLYNYNQFYKSRQYDISGVEVNKNEFDSDEYTVGTSYVFTGFAKGYSNESKEKSTLECTRYDLMTVRVSAHQVTYVSGDSGKGKGYSNQVSSVYFSLPKEIEKTYDNLYSIKYEYEHFYTSPMIVTDNSASYSVLKNDVGKHVDSYDLDYALFTWSSRLLKPGIAYGFYLYSCSYDDYWFGTSIENAQNMIMGSDSITAVSPRFLKYITSVFYNSEEWVEGNVILNSEDVLSYFKSYNASYHTLGGNKVLGYSADLFDLDNSDRYTVKTSNINDTFSLNSYADTHNVFQKWWDYGFTSNKYNKSILDARYIEPINSTSFSGSSVSDTLLVGDDYIDNLKVYYDEVSSSENVYLLRFAYADDYLTRDIKAVGLDGNFMMCQANVYLDFDFIEFGFGDETDLTIIPAVSDPVDVFPDIIPVEPDSVVPDVELPTISDILGIDKNDNSWFVVFAVILIIIVVVIVIITIIKKPAVIQIAKDNISKNNRNRKNKKEERKRKKKSQKKSSGENCGRKSRQNRRDKKRYSRSRSHK